MFVKFSSIVSVVYCDCPDKWAQNGESCYYFSQNYNEMFPWHEAQSWCEYMGGGLVEIDDKNENVCNLLKLIFTQYFNLILLL